MQIAIFKKPGKFDFYTEAKLRFANTSDENSKKSSVQSEIHACSNIFNHILYRYGNA